jgi:hypothetical protein
MAVVRPSGSPKAVAVCLADLWDFFRGWPSREIAQKQTARDDILIWLRAWSTMAVVRKRELGTTDAVTRIFRKDSLRKSSYAQRVCEPLI